MNWRRDFVGFVVVTGFVTLCVLVLNGFEFAKSMEQKEYRMLTEQLLRQMMPRAGARLDPHLPYINPAMEWGRIVTPLDVAAFIAQLAHESGEYRYMREIHDGSNYEGRLDLGNTQPGDGVRYPGRGGIQVTGRAAARAAGRALGVDFESHPEKMERPEWATKVSAWFWPDRLNYYTRNRQILKLPPYAALEEAAAIRRFQRDHGLLVDGDAGPKTLAALRAVSA